MELSKIQKSNKERISKIRADMVERRQNKLLTRVTLNEQVLEMVTAQEGVDLEGIYMTS